MRQFDGYTYLRWVFGEVTFLLIRKSDPAEPFPGRITCQFVKGNAAELMHHTESIQSISDSSTWSVVSVSSEPEFIVSLLS